MLRKPSSEPICETPKRPPNIKCMFTAFFGDLFVGKEVDLRINVFWKLGIRVFFLHVAVSDLIRAFLGHHSQIDIIWPENCIFLQHYFFSQKYHFCTFIDFLGPLACVPDPVPVPDPFRSLRSIYLGFQHFVSTIRHNYTVDLRVVRSQAMSMPIYMSNIPDKTAYKWLSALHLYI